MSCHVFRGLAILFVLNSCLMAQESQMWLAQLKIPKTDQSVEFRMEFPFQDDDSIGRIPPVCHIYNGQEKITIPVVDFDTGYLTFRFPHYDSAIVTNISKEAYVMRLATDAVMEGEFRKRRRNDKWAVMKFEARHESTNQKRQEMENANKFVGKWKVKFDSSDDPAVGVFKKVESSSRIAGTFLTSTGDYRYLDGYVKDGRLAMSCFDGAHAFRFEAAPSDDGGLRGDFWSSNRWHENWSAVRDDNAALPDTFAQTIIKTKSALDELVFPDLSGVETKVNDPRFIDNARLIYVFGSWCPNCHDAAVYFKELQEKYASKGLSILGLAFEVTDDHQRNAKQIREYLARNKVSYPVLLAGPSDKASASRAFPVLDKIRSYPTTIFVTKLGEIKAVHTGFTGPATGKFHTEMKKKFESIIDEMILEAAKAR